MAAVVGMFRPGIIIPPGIAASSLLLLLGRTLEPHHAHTFPFPSRSTPTLPELDLRLRDLAGASLANSDPRNIRDRSSSPQTREPDRSLDPQLARPRNSTGTELGDEKTRTSEEIGSERGRRRGRKGRRRR
jgi:hypothetical protein